jgi:hypothetical protein
VDSPTACSCTTLLHRHRSDQGRAAALHRWAHERAHGPIRELARGLQAVRARREGVDRARL